MNDDLVTTGDRLAGRYRLDVGLAFGGTSAIWRAYDERLDRAVAVKVPVSSDARFEPERLRAEARITARVDHPAVVEIYDYGQAVSPSGRVVPFAVMPLLAGDPLGARLADGPLPWRDAIAVASRVADVLAATHRTGVVHQDVSAENVLLTDQGAVLLDFGLAVEVDSRDPVGRYAGTPPYVAPERVAGSPPHPAGDVYSLGVLLFEMLTGRRPFPETTWEELAEATREDPGPEPGGVPGLPGSAAALCGRMLAAEPADRPDAVECGVALEASLAPAMPGRPLLAAAVAGAASVVLAAVLLSPSEPNPGDGSMGLSDGGSAGVAEPSPRPDVETDRDDMVDDEPGGVDESGEEMDEAADDEPAAASPDAAVDAFLAGLDDGLAAGAIRSDVHLDLTQVASNLYRDGEYAGDDVELLRSKLDDRYREGALNRSAWADLHAEVDAIAAAAR